LEPAVHEMRVAVRESRHYQAAVGLNRFGLGTPIPATCAASPTARIFPLASATSPFWAAPLERPVHTMPPEMITSACGVQEENARQQSAALRAGRMSSVSGVWRCGGWFRARRSGPTLRSFRYPARRKRTLEVTRARLARRAAPRATAARADTRRRDPTCGPDHRPLSPARRLRGRW